MNIYVNILARFADKAHYFNRHPESVKFTYLDNGQELNTKDANKIETITAFYLEHDLYPLFVPTKAINNDSEPFEAEALINLNLWTNSGLPKFNIRDERGIIIDGLPNAKGGRKQSTLIGV